ncbi:MAG TPA: universal stress protein [Acidimicrobiia bacterium]|nr:universal stress protein [Acidimicrobiia bacterium]
MPNPVIVPVDTVAAAERALITGAALAGHAGAELLVVHVAADPDQAARREVELKDALVALGLVGAVVTRWGRAPAEVIAEMVASEPASVLCMATRAPGRFGGAMFGSTAEKLLRAGCGPTLLVGPNVEVQRQWGWKELAVCVDSSPDSEATLPFAAEWADTMALDIRLLHVLNPATVRELRVSCPELHFRDEGYVDSVALDLTSTWAVDADAEILYGAHPAAAITAFLEAHPATLPFLGSHGRSGLRRFLMGSVTARVVHDSPSPVVVVCPAKAW